MKVHRIVFLTVMTLQLCPPVSGAAIRYTFTEIAKTNSTFATFRPPVINNDGTVAFTVSMFGGREALYKSDGASLTRITDNSGAIKQFGRYISINNIGVVAFEVSFDDSSRGVLTGNGTTTTVVYDTTGPFDGTFDSPSINDNGTVAFVVSLDTGVRGVFAGNGAAPTTIAATTGIYSSFGAFVSINNGGTAVFLASLDSGGDDIFTSDGTTTKTIVDSGFDTFSINDSDMVAFVGNQSGINGIFTGNGGSITIIADESGPFSSFRDVSINNEGSVAFTSGTIGGDGISIFTGADPIDDRVITEGENLFGSTIAFLGVSSEGLNDSGQIAFFVRFADGTQGIYRADPSPKPKPLDIEPPTGVVTFIGGKTVDGIGYMIKPTIILRLSVSDNKSSPNEIQMQLRNAADNWTPPEQFVNQRSWTVPIGDGEKQIEARFIDAAGNISRPFPVVFVLDTSQPNVRAGAPPGIKNTRFTQVGTAQDSNGVASMGWSKGSGPGQVVLGTPNRSQTTVEADRNGTYTIRFTATDKAGNTNSDDLTFTWDTTVPTVSAGADAGVQNTVFTQMGTATDTNGIASMTWSKVSGVGSVVFGTPNVLRTTVQTDADGQYTIRLTIRDGAGNTGSDDAEFIWDTTAPTVNAGTNTRVKKSTFTQQGTATDSSGIATTLWTKVSGPGEVTFGSRNEMTTTVRSNQDGDYVIELTATDSASNSHRASTKFTWDTTPPKITHSPIKSGTFESRISIEMNISDTSPTTGKLYYRQGGEREFSQLSMEGTGNTLIGEIPADALKMGVSYYLEAEDLAEHISTYPEKGTDAPIGVTVSGTFVQESMFPAQAWHLFSIPVTVATSNLKSALDNTLGQDNWVADIWTGSENVRAKQPIAAPGNPFWLISKTPFQLQVSGETANPTTPQTLSLRQGWNLVANPYLFEVSFGNVQVMVGDEPLPLDNPKASKLVAPKFWRWTDTTPNDVTDGDYEMVTSLSERWKPWSGYWVFAEDDATVRIAPFTELIHQVTAAPVTPIWDWLTTLAIGNTRGVSRVQLALAENVQWNDVEQPPLPTRISVSLLQDGTRFQRLSLPTSADEWLWEAEIHAEADAQLMLLNSPLIGYHLYLEYLTDGTRVELDSDSSIPVPDGKHRVRFRLTKQRLGRYLEGAIPTATQLLPNYPNPFNPETWIPYQLATDADVQVRIYDISGTLVRRLMMGHQGAGSYVNRERAAYWNGRDGSGEQVSSGLYFYQLRAGDYSATKRMVIVK